MFDEQNPEDPIQKPAILFVADFKDVSDWFDVAYLLNSKELDLQAVLLPAPDPDIESGLTELFSLRKKSDSGGEKRNVSREILIVSGANALQSILDEFLEPVNIISTGSGSDLLTALRTDPDLFRAKVARCFLIGGHANDYSQGRSGERIPIDPRLKEMNPERFDSSGDIRIPAEKQEDFLRLLTSGEGVIWLPGDICLWRFSARGLLSEGGAICDFLLHRLPLASGNSELPALLSSLPAFFLAVQPDPFAWMRLFRVVTAKVVTDAKSQKIDAIDINSEKPNLYMVIAIDSAVLSKFYAAGLKG
jgi:hypothetical protein